MLTEIKRPSATIIECSMGHEANRVGVNPLIIAVIAAFAALHFVSGHMIEQSHASPSIEPSAFAAADDEAKCSPQSPQPKPLPYD